MAAKGRRSLREKLLRIYRVLNDHFGDLHWWPAEGPFEVMIGAVLTQNTAWTNVEKAIEGLRERGLLSPEALERIDETALAAIIRPSGYFRIKAKRIKALLRFFRNGYSARIEAMAAEPVESLREKLLAVSGIGPETADSILLYACGKPVFVSDAYTHRILHRHRLIRRDADVHQIRALFMENLPQDAPLFNQFHALFVATGKTFCRKVPKCGECPLKALPHRTESQ